MSDLDCQYQVSSGASFTEDLKQRRHLRSTYLGSIHSMDMKSHPEMRMMLRTRHDRVSEIPAPMRKHHAAGLVSW